MDVTTTDLFDPVFLEKCVVDWVGIDQQFKELYESLTGPKEALQSDDERSKSEKNTEFGLRAIVDLVRGESLRLLELGNLEEAYYGSIQSLKYSEEIFGNQSNELVPAYLLIAKTTYGLRKYRKCEQFLSLANWGIMKNPHAKVSHQADLRFHLGLLYASTDRMEDAIESLSLHIFHRSHQYDAKSIFTTPGYLQLGLLFQQVGNVEAAVSCYDMVESAWEKFLSPILDAQEGLDGGGEEVDLRLKAMGTSDDMEQEDGGLSKLESVRCMSKVVSLRADKFGKDDVRTAESQRLLGVLYHWLGEDEKAREHLEKSIIILQGELGGQNPRVRQIENLLESIL
jgi:tetratricopeptide (TPR) repeat protein